MAELRLKSIATGKTARPELNESTERIAQMLYAQTLIAERTGENAGIHSLLADNPELRKILETYYLDLVTPRVEKTYPEGTAEKLRELAAFFLDNAEDKPHKKGAPEFAAWVKAELNHGKPFGFVRATVDNNPAGDAIRDMGDRRLRDCFCLIKALFF